MKIKLILTALLLFAGISLSLKWSNASESNTPASTDTQTYRSVGVIKATDLDADRVTVDHEEIPGYMSPMEMNELMADRKILAGLKVGDKVEFEILRTGSKVVYTKFTKIGEGALVSGFEIYTANCAECHGAKGEGAKKGIPFTSGHALDHSEADFIKTVANGKAKGKKKEMPAFRNTLTKDEIVAVVKFIREDIQKGIERPKKQGHSH